jgi:hypothetical protein
MSQRDNWAKARAFRVSWVVEGGLGSSSSISSEFFGSKKYSLMN